MDTTKKYKPTTIIPASSPEADCYQAVLTYGIKLIDIRKTMKDAEDLVELWREANDALYDITMIQNAKVEATRTVPARSPRMSAIVWPDGAVSKLKSVK